LKSNLTLGGGDCGPEDGSNIIEKRQKRDTKSGESPAKGKKDLSYLSGQQGKRRRKRTFGEVKKGGFPSPKGFWG